MITRAEILKKSIGYLLEMRVCRNRQQMNWINRIKGVFGGVAPYEAPRAVIEEDDCGGKHGSGYAVVCHKRKCEDDLQECL